MVIFVVTGGRSQIFKILNFVAFKTKQKKSFVYISITLCTDSVVTYAALD